MPHADERLSTGRARAALALLALLYGSAIFAPLIANDLPLTLVAANERAFQRALRTLPLAAGELDAAFAAGTPAEAERAAVESRLERLGVGLPAESRPALDRVRERFEELERAAREGRAPPALARTAFLEGARALPDELALAREGEPGVRLDATRSFPLFASLGPFEAAAMVLFLAAVTAPLWRRRVRAGVARWATAAALVAVASAWFGAAEESAGLKADMASGGVRVESALFPPVAYGYAETHLAEGFVPPSVWRRGDAEGVEVRPGEPPADALGRHWLGTDALGRDVLARLVHGGRLSLSVALLAAALVTALGLVLGTVAGMFGGWVDALFMRLVEVVQAFPAFLLVLAGVALVPETRLHPAVTIAVVIGAVGWTEIARLVRAELLRLRELDYARTAHALGLSPLRVAFRHLLPLALPPVYVAAAFATSGAVLYESAISFLGFGIGPPAPSWGGLIAVERDASVWWLQLFPGLCVFATVVAFNLLGEALRRRLDPRSVEVLP